MLIVDTETGEMVPFEFKTPYNHNTTDEADRTALICKDPTKAQQSAKDETDINTIVDRFLRTGALPEIELPPQFGDFQSQEDFHELQNRLAETNAQFYKLPAAIRASFNNDAGAWLQEVNQLLVTGDRQGLRTMGITVPDAPAPPEPTGETPKPPTEPPAAPKVTT